MPSNINYASINENFPVPGQDNDTQVFRDNFDTIKNSLNTAKTEVGDLIDNAARTDVDNDFNGNRIANAITKDITVLKYAPGGIISAGEGQSSVNVEINFLNGMYQIYRFGDDANINFEGFNQTHVSKITLELYGDGGTSKNAGSFVVGKTYTISSLGDTTFTSIGAVSVNAGFFEPGFEYIVTTVGDTNWNRVAGTTSVNYTVGTKFTARNPGSGSGVAITATFEATGVGSGSGSAIEHNTLTFVGTGGVLMKKNFSPFWRGTTNSPKLTVVSSIDPIIVEVWRHDAGKIFLNNFGQFS